MTERFEQIREMDDIHERYPAYYMMMPAALTVPNYTEFGFALTKAPDNLLTTLQRAIRDGLPDATREKHIDVILGGDNPPLFVKRPDLTKRVLRELQPYAEEWTGIKLAPKGAYGFRLYRDGNQVRYVRCDHTEPLLLYCEAICFRSCVVLLRSTRCLICSRACL